MDYGSLTYQQLLIGLGVSLIVLLLMYLLPTGKKAESKKEEKPAEDIKETIQEAKPKKNEDTQNSDVKLQEYDARLKNLENKKYEDVRLGNIEQRLSMLENSEYYDDRLVTIERKLNNIENMQYNEPLRVIVEKDNAMHTTCVPRSQVKVHSVSNPIEPIQTSNKTYENTNYLHQRFNNVNKIKAVEKPTVLKSATSSPNNNSDGKNTSFKSEFDALSKSSKVAIVSNLFDRK